MSYRAGMPKLFDDRGGNRGVKNGGFLAKILGGGGNRSGQNFRQKSAIFQDGGQKDAILSLNTRNIAVFSLKSSLDSFK